MSTVTQARTRKITGLLVEDQHCNRCGRKLDRHEFTPLGAVICLELPRNAGLTPWHVHGFKLKDGLPYQALLEQIGSMAGQLEERGLPEGYNAAMARIDAIQHWMNLLMPAGTAEREA
jgi:hypothetical protein